MTARGLVQLFKKKINNNNNNNNKNEIKDTYLELLTATILSNYPTSSVDNNY